VYGQGATMALPIWGLFMKKCYKDDSLSFKVSERPFERPANLSIKVDCWKAPVKDTINSEQVDMDEFLN
jgi:penicillin-binding protein 1A